jgi:hypothetical protein
MRPKRYRPRKKSGDANQTWLANQVDDKNAIMSFAESWLPLIRKAHKEGWSADDVMRHMESAAALRVAAEMMTPGAVGLAAAKDMLDRSKGKAVERKEVAHRLGKLPEQELDALLVSKLAALEDGSGEND